MSEGIRLDEIVNQNLSNAADRLYSALRLPMFTSNTGVCDTYAAINSYGKASETKGAVEAIGHLESLLVANPLVSDLVLGGEKCHFCKGNHKADCPWVAAKAYVDGAKIKS